MSVGQTGHASLWRGQGNIVLQVRARRRSRIIPSVGICHITFLPVTQDWHSWRWLLSGSLTCTRSLLHSGLTNDRPALQFCHIRPVSRQSGSDLSSSLLHHNNIFPSLPWPASSLLISGIAFCLSPCYSLLFLSKVKMYFPQCKRLKLKFRIQRRCGMMLWLNCYVIYFIIPRVSCRE